MTYGIDAIARTCHEANRALQIANGEEPSPHWEDAPDRMLDASREGVAGVISGDTPEESHRRWHDRTAAQGWTYGPVKDEAARTHPAMVPYPDLPEGQKVKDAVFAAIVGAMTGAV